MAGFIEMKNVFKTYQMGEIQIHASAGVNFEIQKSEFVVIVGPSGAGKTTILNILGGNGYTYEWSSHRRRKTRGWIQ